MTNEDARWEALTGEQRALLVKLGKWPWRWFVSDERYAATWARMEKDNRLAARRAAEATQRAYWSAVASRVNPYTGPDYRIRLDGQRTWIRASARQYEWAADTGTQRSIGVPDDAPLALTVA